MSTSKPADPASLDARLRRVLGCHMLGDSTWHDNLAVALCTYFDRHSDCPDEPVSEDFGWKPWVIAQSNRVIDELAAIASLEAARAAPLYAAAPAQPTVWVVADGGGHGESRFRTLEQGMPVWTIDPAEALQFARRQDAELFAAEDDDAWQILNIAAPEPSYDETKFKLVPVAERLLHDPEKPLAVGRAQAPITASERVRILDAVPLLTINDARFLLGFVGAGAMEAPALQAIIDGRAVVVPSTDSKDAARYRWLREQEWFNDTASCVFDPEDADLSEEELDAAIDAALAVGHERGGGE